MEQLSDLMFSFLLAKLLKNIGQDRQIILDQYYKETIAITNGEVTLNKEKLCGEIMDWTAWLFCALISGRIIVDGEFGDSSQVSWHIRKNVS